MIEKDLKTYLLAQAGVSALVGTRVYASHLPQQPTLPAITFNRITGQRELMHSGRSGLAHPQFQVDCWADDYTEVKQLAEQVRLVLEGYGGSMGSSTGCAVVWFGDIDDFDEESESYRVIITVEIWHNE